MKCPECGKRMHYLGFEQSEFRNVLWDIEEYWECQDEMCETDQHASVSKVEEFFDFTKTDKIRHPKHLD